MPNQRPFNLKGFRVVVIGICAAVVANACSSISKNYGSYSGDYPDQGGAAATAGTVDNGGAGALGEIAGTGGYSADQAGAAAAGKGANSGAGARAEGGKGGSAWAGSTGYPPAAVFDAGSDLARNQVQPGQICERLATIQCSAQTYCCDGKTYPALSNYDSCKQKMKSVCADELFIDAISQSPLIGFNAAFAENAFTEYERRSSACDPTVVSWGISMEGLRGILEGTVAPSRSCSPAQATKAAQAAAMASCADGANYACLPAALVWTCTARGQDGDRCFTDINCVDGFYCNNPNLAIVGATCVSRKTTGSACLSANECQSLACKNSRCIPADPQGVYCLGSE